MRENNYLVMPVREKRNIIYITSGNLVPLRKINDLIYPVFFLLMTVHLLGLAGI